MDTAESREADSGRRDWRLWLGLGLTMLWLGRIFERLLREADDCDPNGIIREAVEGSAHDTLYRRIVEYREARAT